MNRIGLDRHIAFWDWFNAINQIETNPTELDQIAFHYAIYRVKLCD